MTKETKRKIRIPNAIGNHVVANARDYIIVSIVFVVGVFFGVMFINNIKDDQKQEVTGYIDNYVDTAKSQGNINSRENLKDEIKSNIILAVSLWFAGTTLIGIPIVFGIILFKGFCLGYTISAITYVMGFTKGLAFIATSIFLQNIILVPAILALGVSGLKLYKSIMKDKRKENIKIEVLRHTAFSGIMLVVLLLSAVIKINVSGSMLESFIKYF